MSTLDAEENPAEELPPVVGAWDPLEAPALRDASRGCPWLSEVPQRDVRHQIEELEEDEDE